MMVANGDANKPIWISEAGWDPVPNDPAIADAERYGRVTMAQAAEWAPLAYERALKEWPWIGVVTGGTSSAPIMPRPIKAGSTSRWSIRTSSPRPFTTR